ncbi:hypothetical protein FACS189452_03100 [Bacteroidia bacterium]|nr:hypothetical protein FACS189452_03100 [Bacteroidia bacterium]
MINNKLYRFGITCIGLIVALWVGDFCEAQAQDAQIPRMRRVTIDFATQRHRVDWDAPEENADSVLYYHIGRRINGETGGWQLTALREGGYENYTPAKDQRTYVFTNLRCCESQAFAIRALYNNDTSKLWSEGFLSMQQLAPVVDSCAHTFTLSWTPYNKISSYNQFYAISSFERDLQYLVFACDSDVFDPARMYYFGSQGNSKKFVLNQLEGKKKYSFVIAAVYNDGADTSYSNIQSLSFDFSINPLLKIDSVISRGAQNHIYFTINPNTDYSHFVVEKSLLPESGFVTVADFHSKSVGYVVDNQDNSRSYYYRVSALNTFNECESIISSSLVIGSINVEIIARESDNIVKWNDVQNDSTNTATFSVYRTSPNKKLMIPTTQLWLSDIDIEDHYNTNYCYYVNATVTDSTKKEIAFVQSNTVCYDPVPIWFMPNAVAPFSNVVNYETGVARNRFQPLCKKTHTFLLKIYNRWGKEVYSGNAGWNGRTSTIGEDAPEGAYTYWVQMRFSNGKTEEKTGSVTVIWSE